MATRRKSNTKRASNKKVSGKTSATKHVDYKSLRIVLVERASPRRQSSKAGKRYTDMVKYLAKHRKATAKEVFKATSYRSDDAQWDAKRGYVKLVRAA